MQPAATRSTISSNKIPQNPFLCTNTVCLEHQGTACSLPEPGVLKGFAAGVTRRVPTTWADIPRPGETAYREMPAPITGRAIVTEDVGYGTKNKAMVAVARMMPRSAVSAIAGSDRSWYLTTPLDHGCKWASEDSTRAGPPYAHV